MVRNEQLEPTSDATKIIAQFVKEQITQQGHTVEEVAKKLGRAKSYASIRLSGLKPFSIDDLATIATMLGYTSMFTLISDANNNHTPIKIDFFDSLDLAANEDINKNLERELDDFGA